MMNKPIYTGQSVLDISKILLYEFLYDYMIPKYGNKARLCYDVMDSAIFIIFTEDFYADIAPDVDR